MDNKKFLYIGIGFLVLLIIVALVAVSCAGKNNKKTDQTNTLTIWDITDNKTFFNKMIADFQSNNPNIKVSYEVKNPKDYLDESLNKIAAGVGPDVWAIPNTWLPKYQDKLVAMPDGSLADKKAKKSDVEVYKETYPAVVTQDNIIKDKIYGMPLTATTLKLFVNSSILYDTLQAYQKAHSNEDIGIIKDVLYDGPKNWDEVVLATKLVTENSNGKLNQSAIALGTSDNINSPSDIMSLLMLQYGAKMTSDDNTTAQFQTEQNLFGGSSFPGTKALEFYTSFAKTDSENYTWNSSMPDSLRAFAEGKTAMMIDYENLQDEVKRINPKASFKIMNVPQVKETKNVINYASYNSYTVTKASKNPDTAWSFVRFMTNDANTNNYLSITHKPSIKSKNIGSDNSISTAKSWFIPDPYKTIDIFKNMIKQVNDGIAPQNSIDNAASQITTLLQKLKE